MRAGTLPNSNLTLKQRAFVSEYLTNGLNGAQAVLDAGYETDRINAPTIAHNQLRKPAVQEAVEQELAMMEVDHGITFDYKIGKLKTIVERTIPDDGFYGAADGYKTGISAIAELNKMQGHYAAEKRVNVNVNAEGNLEQLKEIMDGVIKQNEREF